MEKSSDINDVLSGLGNKARDAGGAMSSWYQGLNPEVRSTLARGLVGAGAGAALTGGMAAVSGREDPEHRHNVKGQALLGALLGGTAAAGLPLGLKMLGGGIDLNGESKKPLIAHGGDKIIGGAVRHPATTALGGAALLHPRSRESWGQFYDTLRETSGSTLPLKDRLKQAIQTMDTRAGLSETIADPGFKGLGKATENTWVKDILADAAKLKVRPGQHIRPGRLATIPLAVGGGLMLDKYLRGEY